MTTYTLFTHSPLCAQKTKCFPQAGRDGMIHCDHLSFFISAQAGRDGMIHYGQLVPRGLYGWGGYGGSGGQETFNHQTVTKYRHFFHPTMLFWTNKMVVAVFIWDKEKQLGFVYIPTYLAW